MTHRIMHPSATPSCIRAECSCVVQTVSRPLTQQALGDGDGAQCILAGPAAGVAHAVAVTDAQAQGLLRVQARVHASQHQGLRGRQAGGTWAQASSHHSP